MQRKTALTGEDIALFLRERFDLAISNVHPMVEGEDSQAFSFDQGGNGYVIRVNTSIEGFQKDAYAYDHFRSARIPIPKTLRVGHIDAQHAFSITEYVPGLTLQVMRCIFQACLSIGNACSVINSTLASLK